MSVEVYAVPIALSLFCVGCSNTKDDPKTEAPFPVKVENEDFNVVYVDHPEQFPLATAVEYVSIRQVTATGTVQADVSRTVPVVSIAEGGVVEIHAWRRDALEARRILLCVQNPDLSGSDCGRACYQRLARLAHVWVVCDVYENDLRNVNVDEPVEIRPYAYPERVFTGHIRSVGGVLEPMIRTAKVRIEVCDTGLLLEGMSVSVTFGGNKKETRAAVPATAILHFHDRDWVYVPNGSKAFRRVDVAIGKMLPGNLREVISGMTPGTQVVKNALDFQSTLDR